MSLHERTKGANPPFSEKELLDSRDRLEAIVHNAADAIITIDATGTIEAFNPAAEGMFGYSADEVVGRNVGILMCEPDREEHDGYIRRYLETGEARVIGRVREVRGRRKDGTTILLELTLSENRRRRIFTAILRDITERTRLHEELAWSHERLRSLSARLLVAEQSERRSLARELHDDFSQRLAMLSIDLDLLKAASSPELARKLGGLAERVAELAEDLHRLAYGLHPSILDHLGLPAALRRLVDELASRQGIEVVFRERGFPENLEPTKASCLYRIAQEALANVAKHSMSSRATVRLVGTPEGIRLVVRDRGRGFDVERTRRREPTLGLTGMEERVRLFGGTLVLRSKPGRGTSVSATCTRQERPEEELSESSR